MRKNPVVIAVRVKQADYRALHQIADRESFSVGVLLRRMIRDILSKRKAARK